MNRIFHSRIENSRQAYMYVHTGTLRPALSIESRYSHFCKIKRRCSFLYNLAQSVLENRTIILLYLAERHNSGRQGTLRIDLSPTTHDTGRAGLLVATLTEFPQFACLD